MLNALLARWRQKHRTIAFPAGEPALPAGPIRSVAVLCAGNLCRSPFAAALLARARPELAVGSFGLAAALGHPADPRAIALAAEWGCDLSVHRTRPLGDPDALGADLVLAMDALQGRAFVRRWPAAAPRLRLLGDFLSARPFAIVDPWSQGDPVWRTTYARIEAAVARLAQRLEDAA